MSTLELSAVREDTVQLLEKHNRKIRLRLGMSTLGDLIYSANKKLPSEIASKAETHAPKIEAPDKVKPDEEFTVSITVGPHPSVEDHFIRWIDIYIEEQDRAFNPVHAVRVELSPIYAQPHITVKLKLKRTSILHVVAYCNKHGLWESKKEIKVVT